MIPLRYNLRSLRVRKTTTLVTAFGVGLVVFVLASSLMLVEGIERTLVTSGRDDTAIVLRKGSDAELSSGIEKKQVGLIFAKPGVKKDGKGAPLGVGEVVVVIIANKTGTEYVSNVRVRGVPDNVYALRENVTIVEGRPARPGTNEVVIGENLVGRFDGMGLGETFELRKNRPVKVVGVMDGNGSSYSSEIWGDVDVVRSSFGRDSIVSSIRVRLASGAKFDAFEASVEQDKQLGLEAMRETDYYRKASEGTSGFVKGLGIFISVFFAVGAMIGAMITMHAAVASRRREIGTLRALGFSRANVLLSFVIEAIMLATLGGIIGAVGSLAMRFVNFSMMSFSGWNEMVFSFTPTPQIVGVSVLAGAVMGLLGGFLPALRASRVSPAAAMRN